MWFHLKCVLHARSPVFVLDEGGNYDTIYYESTKGTLIWLFLSLINSLLYDFFYHYNFLLYFSHTINRVNRKKGKKIYDVLS